MVTKREKQILVTKISSSLVYRLVRKYSANQTRKYDYFYGRTVPHMLITDMCMLVGMLGTGVT